MGKSNLSDVLKQRMSATQQATELQMGEAVYEHLFAGSGSTLSAPTSKYSDLPLDKLVTFFTADIGFKAYSAEKLQAFADQLAVDGLFERIIVRPVPGADTFEILAGHNRAAAFRLNGWATIPATIVEADDARAITIATATNLLRRQELTILERGKAYKALLDAQRKQGHRTDLETSGDNRQKFLAREVVAEFFGVTEYEIRKAVKLTSLIQPLADLVENNSKALPLACAELIADYDPASQEAFVEMCGTPGYRLNKATVKALTLQCPPPSAGSQALLVTWWASRAAAERRPAPQPKKITFERKRFQPYLDKLGSEEELERLFLEFLKSQIEHC